jgi:hypothetical protein
MFLVYVIRDLTPVYVEIACEGAVEVAVGVGVAGEAAFEVEVEDAVAVAVEDLVEPQPPPTARSTYWDEAELEWARQWPSEAIWKARKE